MNTIGLETKDLESEITTKKIIYVNKSLFEQARIDEDYRVMRSVLQNLYDNLYPLAKRESRLEVIKEVWKILKWYDSLPSRYSSKQPDGSIAVVYPSNMEVKINIYFSKAYIKLNKILGDVL